ncbi:Serine--tRNA ligase, mitochondrial [Schistosoma japonicum]|nr:Serine--tRNA ligase, mitochondrial [Schistosoma japonicum]KAH8853420.1 Serine--tRNA ligase, mitochondrial [Schistosoma japonicum]KAH8853421.1 Serine--tRNA ligase, mitochondrial [Schistosoma japonicum]
MHFSLQISSSSICLDYQSKRLNIRWQTPNNQNEFAYTLNGTACAIPRMMKALIETHQTKDRRVIIPDVLRRYMKMEYLYPTLQLKRISSHKS